MLPLVYLYIPGPLLLLLVFTDYVLATVEKDVQEGFNQENRKFGNARYWTQTLTDYSPSLIFIP